MCIYALNEFQGRDCYHTPLGTEPDGLFGSRMSVFFFLALLLHINFHWFFGSTCTTEKKLFYIMFNNFKNI